MNFSLRFALFLLLTLYVTVSKPEEYVNCTTLDTHDECPTNAICTVVNETAKNFQCTCLPNYVRNPLWQQVISGNSNDANAFNNNNKNNNNKNSTSNGNINTVSNQLNILNNVNASGYCLNVEATNATSTTNGKVYVRQPAKIEHLAFGILMVLFVAIAAISLLYLLKVLRPIKRSRAVYTQLRRRRENRERLEEFRDDISMIELNEKR